MTSRGVTRDDQQKQHADDSYPQRSDARAAQSEIPRGESGVGGGMTSQNLRGNGDTPTSPGDSSTPSSSRRASTADSGSGVAPDAVPSLSASGAKLDESEMGLPRMHRCSCVLLPVDECAYERGVRDACRLMRQVDTLDKVKGAKDGLPMRNPLWDGSVYVEEALVGERTIAQLARDPRYLEVDDD